MGRKDLFQLNAIVIAGSLIFFTISGQTLSVYYPK
jgi:hypothetical protein